MPSTIENAESIPRARNIRKNNAEKSAMSVVSISIFPIAVG